MQMGKPVHFWDGFLNPRCSSKNMCCFIACLFINDRVINFHWMQINVPHACQNDLLLVIIAFGLEKYVWLP